MEELAMFDKKDKTDDDMIVSSASMAKSLHANDPPRDFFIDPDNILKVRAQYEYSIIPELQSKIYAISDSGADSFVLGKMAKITYGEGLCVQEGWHTTVPELRPHTKH